MEPEQATLDHKIYNYPSYDICRETLLSRDVEVGRVLEIMDRQERVVEILRQEEGQFGLVTTGWQCAPAPEPPVSSKRVSRAVPDMTRHPP